MIRIVLGALFAATLAVTGLAQTSQAPALPLAGKAGQTLAPSDISTFGGSTLVSATWAGVETLGRLAAGTRVTERIRTQTGCKLKITHVNVEAGNGGRVQRKVARGTGNVTIFTKANFDGVVISIVNVQSGSSTCSIFRNRTFASS